MGYKKNTKVYAEDANFDYEKAFRDNNFPSVIDYLSIDLIHRWQHFMPSKHATR